jgi:hypothetical protein
MRLLKEVSKEGNSLSNSVCSSKSCNRHTLFPKAHRAGLNHEADSQLHHSLQ